MKKTKIVRLWAVVHPDRKVGFDGEGVPLLFATRDAAIAMTAWPEGSCIQRVKVTIEAIGPARRTYMSGNRKWNEED